MIVIDTIIHSWDHNLARFILIHTVNQVRNLHFYRKKNPLFLTLDRNRGVVRRVQLNDPIALRQQLSLTPRSIAHGVDPVLNPAVHIEIVGVVRGGDEENERFLGHKPHI